MSGMFGAGIGRTVFLVASPAANSPSGAPSTSAEAKRPRARLLASTALLGALIALAIPDRAGAQTNDACGPLDATGSVTCTPADNPYPDGIFYVTPPATPGDDLTLPNTPVVDLSVVLEAGVIVDLADPATPGPAIALRGYNGGSATLVSGEPTLAVTYGDGQTGLIGLTHAGALNLSAPDIITEGAGSRGIDARTTGGGSIVVNVGNVHTYGADARAIGARTEAGGSVTVDSLGTVYTYGDRSAGIVASTSGGTTTIDANNVITDGHASDAIIGIGDSVSIAATGRLATLGGASYGVYANALNGPAAVTLSGDVETAGFNSRGVSIFATGGATLAGTGTIATRGISAIGATVMAGDGDAIVDLAVVRTTGNDATGIAASSVYGDARVRVRDASTRGSYANAISAFSTYGDVAIVSDGTVSTASAVSTAIRAESRGRTDVSVNNVSAAGEDSGAIVALGGEANVTITGDVSTSGDSNRVLPGLYLSTVFARATGNRQDTSGVATIVNNGSVTSSGYQTAGITARGENGVDISGSGAVATSGDRSFGIRSLSGGTTMIDQDSVATEGHAATAIDVRSEGDAWIDNGTVTTAGTGSTGINVVGNGAIHISVGSLSTGAGTHGIAARSYGAGEIGIDVSTGTATGDDASVVFARAFGAGAIDIRAGTLTVSGADSSAVNARTYGAGSLAIDAEWVTANGDGSFGLRGRAMGGGNALVDAGTITVTGDSATGIALRAVYGDAIASFDSVTVTGYAPFGADVDATNGTASVSVGSVRVDGAEGVGAVARGMNASIIVDGSVVASGERTRGVAVSATQFASIEINGSVSVTGDFATAVAAQSYTGDVRVVGTGPISTTGHFSAGAFGNALGGDLFIDLASVSTQGTLATGVRAVAQGDATVLVGSVSTSGREAPGIDASSRLGNVRVVSTGSVHSEAGNGVFAASGGNVDVTVNDATIGGRYGGNAVLVIAGDGKVTINGTVESNAVPIFGGIKGVVLVASIAESQAREGASFTATVMNNGSIIAHGADSAPILVDAISDVTISGAGSVRSTGNGGIGISADSRDGNVSLAMGSVETAGEFARGVRVTANEGNGSVAVGSVATAGDYANAIDVRVGGSATITGGSIRTSGDNSRGVDARSFYGALVAFDSIETAGSNAGGIRVRTPGAIDVSLRNGSTAGPASNLIDIGSGEGGIHVTSTGLLSVSGAGSTLINAQSDLSVDVAVNDATVAGDGSRGIFTVGGNDANVTLKGNFTGSADQATANSAMIAVSSYGTASLVNSGAIRTTGTNQSAVEVRGYAGATVSGTGSIATTGDGARGLYAGANTVGVAVWQGSVSTTGADAAAIVARSYGTTLVDVGSASTAGARSSAILAEGGESVSVRVTNVSTAGTASDGIVARSYGPASVVAGSVTVTGDDALGIIATSLLRGDANVTAAGPVLVAHGEALVAISGAGAANVRAGSVSALGAGFNAVYAQGATTASLIVDQGGVVWAAGDTIVLTSGTGSTLINAGTILGTNGYAVRVFGAGAAAIANSGTIAGALRLTAQADGVTNSGTMILAGGTDFAAGNDTLSNSGTLLLAGNMDFGTGADTFVNSGLVAFVSPAGNALRAAAAAPAAQSRTLAGLESFANAGLIDLRDGVAGDMLTTGGAFAGSGSSTLGIDVRLDAPAIADRLVIARAATGSTIVVLNRLGSGNPVLQPGVSIVQAGPGTSASAFTLDPSARFRGFIEFGLVYEAAVGSFALAGAPAPTASRLIKLGEGAQTLWLESADAVSSHLASLRDSSEPARGLWLELGGGLAARDETRNFDTFGLVQTVDLGYRQDGFGGQIGLDLGGGGFSFGVTGGYRSSVMRFAAGGDRAHFDVFNGGVYARLRAGGLFVNALAKYDHYAVRTSLPSIGAADRFNGSGYGGRIEAGYRLGSERFYVEPSLSLSYSRTELDGTGAFGARVDFADRGGLRGTAGLGLGSRVVMAGGTMLTLYASAQAVREFAGADGIAFTTGATILGLDDRRLGVYGAGRLGASIGSGRVAGFIEADGRYGARYQGGGGRVGLRIGF